MHKLLIILALTTTTLSAQKASKVYTTKFVMNENYYYVSGGPNQCIAAISYGIEIKTDTQIIGFFRMDYREMEKLKEKIGDADVQIEVSVFGKDLEGNGTLGEVLKISMNGVVIWKE